MAVGFFPGWLSGLKQLENRIQAFLGVAEQHARVLLEEQRILHACVTGGHGAFQHDGGAALPAFQNRHAADRAVGLFKRGRVHDVVGADDDGDIDVREIVVDLVHLEDDVIRHLGLGQQHVHVAGHAAGDRVDARVDRGLDPLLQGTNQRHRACINHLRTN